MPKISRRTLLTATSAMVGASMLPASVAVAEDIKWNEEYQVVVAGGGAAGCMAAIEAARQGAKVLLVHAGGRLGGSSALSSGWIRASNTKWHEKKGIKDTTEAYYKDIMAYGNGTRNEKKAKVISEEAKDFVNYLMDIGVEFKDEEDRTNGGETVRLVKAVGNGAGIMKKLVETVESTPNITVKKNTKLVDVLLNGPKDQVLGAVIESKDKKEFIKTPSVVIATGGFGRNQEIIEQFTNSWAKTGRTMDVNDKGEGLKIAANLGAGVANLDIAMIVPTMDVTKGIFYSTTPIMNGGILVNEEGRRFTNEYVIYTTTPRDMLKQKQTYLIVTQELDPLVDKMIQDGVTTKCDTLEEVAKVIGAPVENLKADIEEHNAITRQKPEERKDRFGRVVYNKELKPPFYVVHVTPVMIETVGGFMINDKSEVTSLFGKPVAKGLYGAGSAAFGEHFGTGYRSGEAYAYAGVTGMVAGREAAKNALGK